MTKYIFVTGGVVSGLGKGITAASLGRLLKESGLRVASQKLDPYMNVDPGTMSPFQHGEVFVTEDGAETDLDLGHYERFIDEELNKYSNLTSGRVYWNVLNRERAGGYLGETVQVIPHITTEIKEFIYESAKSTGADILITEIGGTVGDIESQPFLEAIRQMSLELGEGNVLFIHVTLVPYIKSSGEYKTKPTQHSVKDLRATGITPNVIVIRSDAPLDAGTTEKIALFCNVKTDCVIQNTTVSCLYEAPIMLHENGLDAVVRRELRLDRPEPDLAAWRAMMDKVNRRDQTVNIALVGKYVRLHDAYLSVNEALSHAGYENAAQIDIRWVDSETLDAENIAEQLKDVDGVLVPGGFGERGIEGMVAACRHARVNHIPYLGICLGMQVSVIEYARHVAGLHEATSGEFAPEHHTKVIDLMEEQQGVVQKGGTMRLGRYPCKIKEGSKLEKAYGQELIWERHRHRYEYNNEYREKMTGAGLAICGMSPDQVIVEAVEIPEEDFFVGVQFHPEFKSRPNRPHPLFVQFVAASIREKQRREEHA